MKKVLITALGSASAISSVRSLQAAGMFVVGCDLYPREWNEASIQVDAFFQGKLASDPEYALQIYEMAQHYQVDYLIPLTDPEVDYWSVHQEEASFTVCVPSRETTGLCRDKLRMSRFLSENKLCTVIPTYVATEWTPSANDFPVLLKPQQGRSSQAQRIVFTGAEYDDAVKSRTDYIAQPYLPGLIHTVDVARDSTGRVLSLCRAELLRTVNGLGTTVKLLPGHPLEEICRRIVESVQYLGVCNIEFIERNGKYYFLEVNPRFSGGVGFSITAGVDFALMMIDCHSLRQIGNKPDISECILTRRIEPMISSVNI